MSGFIGVTCSSPFLKACATGRQPSGWAPETRYGFSSTAPIAISSENARWTFVRSAPEAIDKGAVERSGMRKGAYLSVEGLDSDADVPKIPRMLAERGYSPDSIDMIMGENFLRVFKAVAGG